MSQERHHNRSVKAVIGTVLLLAAVSGGVLRSLPASRWAFEPEGYVEYVSGLEGIGGVLSVLFDGQEHTGQLATRILAVDVLIEGGVEREALGESLEAAGERVLEGIEVQQKLVVTGYRRAGELEYGGPFAARELWLSPEVAEGADGWMTVRLPDEKREAGKALEGIYSGVVAESVEGGVLAVRVDFEKELLRRPTADAREILAAPFLDTLDWDNAFERSQGLEGLEVKLYDGEELIGRAYMTREAYEGTDVTGLCARMVQEALAVSQEEMKVAERYLDKGIFTPLLFESEVSQEDKAEVARLEGKRREAEGRFYEGLFAGGEWKVREEAE